MSIYFYKAFNLIIQSDFECPTLEVVEAQKADVVIQKERLNHLKNDHQFHGVPGRLYFHVPTIVTMDVRDGNTILVDVEDTADFPLAQAYITGSALGIILQQRGLLVLHANAIAINDEEAALFVGASGAGKSTTANAFMQAGFEVLTDDVSAIEFDKHGNAWVLPAYPSIKLWQDVAQRDYDLCGLRPIASREKKFYVKADAQFCHDKRKVQAIYGLEVGDEVSQEELHGAAAFDWLHQQIYRLYLVQLLGQQEQCFRQIAKLAKVAELYKIERPLNHCHDKLIKVVMNNSKVGVK